MEGARRWSRRDSGKGNYFAHDIRRYLVGETVSNEGEARLLIIIRIFACRVIMGMIINMTDTID